MDTLRIKAFLLAVKHKSLSKAAEEFSYTPSALSNTGMRLSEEGELLLARLTAVVEPGNFYTI